MVRLPIYVERLAAKGDQPAPRVQIVRETRTSAVVDGDNGMGQVVGQRAMELAIEKAERRRPACSCRCATATTTAPPPGSPRWPRPHDMIGLAFTIGGINHMVPWGGAEAMLGNNPFAIALPAARRAAGRARHGVLGGGARQDHRRGEGGAADPRGLGGRTGRGADHRRRPRR